jgi:general stress protein YciG
MTWHGDSKGHAIAGRKGGKAQGKKSNPANFARNKRAAVEAGKRSWESRKATGQAFGRTLKPAEEKAL